MRAAILAAMVVSAAAFWDTCPRGPVGSCNLRPCSQIDGPTVCRYGQCICDTGYCRYPNSRVHAQPRRCRAQVPHSSCHASRFCYNGGLVASSCVGGRCLCRTGMHIGEDGECHSGYWPDEEHCNTDTGGNCKLFGCAASRGPTTCTGMGWESGTGHQCHCKPGYCATKEGVCRRQRLSRSSCPNQDTGGSCSWFGCDGSRNAVCRNHKCVCQNGCSIDGQCHDWTSLELAANGNMTQHDYVDTSADLKSDEDWEMRLNALTAMAFVSLPFAAVVGGVMAVKRISRNWRSAEGGVNEKLLQA